MAYEWCGVVIYGGVVWCGGECHDCLPEVILSETKLVSVKKIITIYVVYYEAKIIG